MKTYISRGHIRCTACRVATAPGERIIEIRGNVRLCSKCTDDVVFFVKNDRNRQLESCRLETLHNQDHFSVLDVAELFQVPPDQVLRQAVQQIKSLVTLRTPNYELPADSFIEQVAARILGMKP